MKERLDEEFFCSQLCKTKKKGMILVREILTHTMSF